MNDNCPIIKKPKTIRLIPYYNAFLLKMGVNIIMNYENTEECLQKINNFIQEAFTTESIPQAIEEIENYVNNSILDLAIFDWLKDDIACCYVWMKIKNTPAVSLGGLEINGSLYDYLFQNKTPTSTSERYDLIIKFFDYWNNEKHIKIMFLDHLKSSWAYNCNLKKPFSWLNKNDEDMCNWVWSYLISSKKIPIFYTPINTGEKYIFSHSIFYFWDVPIEVKTLFLININKAKNQNKFRKSIQTKQALNTYIDKETKRKLDSLAKKNEKKINEMLEIIINKEFETENSIHQKN